MSKRHKYNAKTVFEDGYRFPSLLEWRRYKQLKILQSIGAISGLSVHPEYKIVWPVGETEDKATICIVELDFEYKDHSGVIVYEDCKGVDTALSRLKRKLVQAAYGIDVAVITSLPKMFHVNLGQEVAEK